MLTSFVTNSVYLSRCGSLLGQCRQCQQRRMNYAPRTCFDAIDNVCIIEWSLIETLFVCCVYSNGETSLDSVYSLIRTAATAMLLVQISCGRCLCLSCWWLNTAWSWSECTTRTSSKECSVLFYIDLSMLCVGKPFSYLPLPHFHHLKSAILCESQSRSLASVVANSERIKYWISLNSEMESHIHMCEWSFATDSTYKISLISRRGHVHYIVRICCSRRIHHMDQHHHHHSRTHIRHQTTFATQRVACRYPSELVRVCECVCGCVCVCLCERTQIDCHK